MFEIAGLRGLPKKHAVDQEQLLDSADGFELERRGSN